MTERRRGRGEGGLYFDTQRNRWVAEITVGFGPTGKRRVRRRLGRTKTEAREKLREALKDQDDGLLIGRGTYTVSDAVREWLEFGLVGRAPATIAKWEHLTATHVLPSLGRRRLADLTAGEVDRWLAEKANTLSTSTLQNLHNGLRRAVKQAMARDRVKRNVVELCSVPRGQQGRPSRSLTLEQAKALLSAAAETPMHAYITVSLLTGARTEELRALTWAHVDLEGDEAAVPPRPPSMQVWRSVRQGGDTKTQSSRRTLALPAVCVAALRQHQRQQVQATTASETAWHPTGLVFATSGGRPPDASNIRRAFRAVVAKADLDPTAWTPRELRHSFVSLLSANGMPIEQIAELLGHRGSRVTQAVYRHQLRPVILDGAVAMDALFES